MSKRLALLFSMMAFICVVSCDSDNESSEECDKNFCDGNVANICENGQLSQITCPFGCENGLCSPLKCTNGQHSCAGNTPQQCINGVWYPQTRCNVSEVCRNGVCESRIPSDNCENDAMQCSNRGVPQKCIRTRWIDQTPCANGFTCVVGECKKTNSCTNGSLKCSDDGIPYKCENSIWKKQSACGANTVCKFGKCVENLDCGGVICAEDETCTNHVCVPNAQFSMIDGTKCDPETWVDYCTDDGEAVSCATLSGVYREKCAHGCVVADMTLLNDGEYWHPSFCDSDKSQLCRENDIYLEKYYCFSEKKVGDLKASYYESSYQCAEKIGGGYFALDYNDYYEATACLYGCDDNLHRCAELVCKEYCVGNVLNYCGESGSEEMDCTELDAFCRSFSKVDYADCFDSADICPEANATKTSCDIKNGKSIVTTRTCLSATNVTEDKMYWVKTSTKTCSGACNSSKTDCAQ